VNEDLERRLAANEDVFRRVNDGIARGSWPSEPESPLGFRCECARLGCNMLLRLTPTDYQRVRSHPRHFVLVRGHEMPEVERVVETLGDILIIEKIGVGAVEAQERDPR
jgi:hypothetical protein